ncbi:MAG: molybdopterin-dependent oxidoreductase [Chloroflexi bacterium]|nr:molybdopterin-dependent oxidoreductase [Chloroflexota bacterium]
MTLDIVGQPLPRIDAIEKVTGSAEFTGDMRLRNMLVGKVLRSPHAHARIAGIDTSRARSLPGVYAAISFQDAPKVLWNRAGFPHPPGVVQLEDQYILCDKARYVGDAVAAVAAVDENTAREALALIRVEYEPLPAVFEPQVATAEGAPLIHSAANNIARHTPAIIGSMKEGFKEADYVFEGTYATSKAFQCTMEPCGVSIAAFDQSGRLTVWASTQMPHLVRGIIAKAMAMRVGDVRVIKPYVGGGFGSRLGAVNEPICALLARFAGKPVKLQYTLEESFVATESRHPIVFELKTGIKKDGTFTARQMKAILNAGAYATHTPSVAGPVCGWFLGVYKTPNMRFDGYSVYTNTSPCGAYRGYGNPQAMFAVETQVDDIARELGIDPLEIRTKNHLCKGDVWPISGLPIEACGFEEVIKRGSEGIGWKEKRGNADAGNGTKKRGVGMAFGMHVCNAFPKLYETSGAIIKINEDGTANLVYCNSDSGQGSSTALTQIAAQELGLRFEDVKISRNADTETALFDIGSHASRQIYSGGNVVRKAAADAKKKLLALASELLETSADDLEVSESRVWVKGSPERHLAVAEVAHQAHFAKMPGRSSQPVGFASEEPPGNPPVYAAQFAEVEVDTETGVVTVLNIAAAHDVGKAINPAAVEGQIQGALQHGVGYALTESLIIDKENGRPLNGDFHDYKVLTMLDMPRVQPIIVEVPSDTGPFGAKSIGESGLVPTAAAIGNAIYDAVGIRLNEIPFTPEAVLNALRRKRNE